MRRRLLVLLALSLALLSLGAAPAVATAIASRLRWSDSALLSLGAAPSAGQTLINSGGVITGANGLVDPGGATEADVLGYYLGAAAWLSPTGDLGLLAASTAASTYQPLDSDLTSIAALTTTSFGRGLLDDADAAAGRTSLGVVIGTDVQAYDAELATISGYSLVTPPTTSGESFTNVLIRGRQYNLLASNIADLVANPPTGWAWVNATNTVSSASVSGGTLTINADTAHSYNTTNANPVLYLTTLGPSATLTAHCKCSGNESFEGCFAYVSESRGATDGVRIGPAGSDCDLESYDSTSVKPLAMACDDWWWVRVTVQGTVVSWYMQSNGSADSAEPTTIGTNYTNTWVYGGQTTLQTREGAYQTELGIGILRTGAVSGAFRMACNAVRITTPGEP